MTLTARTARLAAVVALVVGATVGLAGPALAHNVLTGSDPVDGAILTKAPSTITLTFDQPVQNFEPVMTVTGPNGNRFETGPPAILGNQASVPVNGAGPVGGYTASYRVVSADGHPVTGEIHYTLEAAAAGTATGQPAATPTSPDSGSAGLSGWLWAGIGVAAALVIAALVVILRRPRED